MAVLMIIALTTMSSEQDSLMSREYESSGFKTSRYGLAWKVWWLRLFVLDEK